MIKFIINNWKWIISTLFSAMVIVFTAGRFTEKTFQRLDNVQLSQERVQKTNDVIVDIVVELRNDVNNLKLSTEKIGIIQERQIQKWDEYLKQDKDVNKELYSRLTDGLQWAVNELKSQSVVDTTNKVKIKIFKINNK
jgi:hypothetical protein